MREVFAHYLLEALVNAAKIDGSANAAERTAIAVAMSEAKDEEFPPAEVDAAIERAALTREELASYLERRGEIFSTEQKMFLMSSLISVIAADGQFDEREKITLMGYLDAVGVDPRRSASVFSNLMEPFRHAV